MVRRVKDDVFLYVEGGGDSLNEEFRQAFASLLEKSALGTTKRPRVVPCGSRDEALKSFRTALGLGKRALLLVDSEGPIDEIHQSPADKPSQWRPWGHLKQRDAWRRPGGAKDADCHFMVQMMESWFLADWDALAAFFGQGFDASRKPNGPLEQSSKNSIELALKQASRHSRTKGEYSKGLHSFKILAALSAERLTQQSPWAKRLVDELERRKS